MIEIILLALGISIGIAIGWKYREMTALQKIRRMREHLAKVAAEMTTVVSITKEDDQFLVHNEETGEFLAQGATHEEIQSILSKRYPGRTFIADPSNLRKIGYKHDAI